MKTLLLTLTTLTTLLAASHYAAAQAGPALPAADKAAIVATLAQFQKNLNDHQFSEMPTYTTPDFSFVNVVGMFWQGEPEVQHAHQAIFDRIYKGVTMPAPAPGELTFRAITPEVVLVTNRIVLPQRSDAPQTAVAGSTAAMFTTLLVKRQGRWLITAGQNTPVDARAAASDPSKTASR